MRRSRHQLDTQPATEVRWVDTLPAGGLAKIDPSVPTAGALVAAPPEVSTAA